jgi:hypothetical protein
MQEAGLPDGILQVVQGDKEMVDAILDHPEIKAVELRRLVRHRALCLSPRRRGQRKRVQAMGGAKNHGIVMPDADLDQVVNDLAGAAFGSAGERCMALPVVVPVGEKTAIALIAKSCFRRSAASASACRPMARRITARSSPPRTRRKIEGYIQMGVDEGAELVVDGRGFTLQGHEDGFFVGPTLFDRVTPHMKQLSGRDLRPRPPDGARRQLRGSDCACRATINMATASRSSPATATRRANSPRGSMSAWSASTCRSRCRSPTTPSAGGSASSFGDTQPARPGRLPLLHQDQDDHLALARWRSRRRRQRLRHSHDGMRFVARRVRESVAPVLTIFPSLRGMRLGAGVQDFDGGRGAHLYRLGRAACAVGERA